MNIGITGTRRGPSKYQKAEFLSFIKTVGQVDQFHHGACVGVDEYYHDLMVHLCIKTKSNKGDNLYPLVKQIVVHPPIIKSWTMSGYKFDLDFCFVLPPMDYLGRNKEIVRAVDILIAMPKTQVEEWRSGTWSTVRYAQKIKKQVVIILPEK